MQCASFAEGGIDTGGFTNKLPSLWASDLLAASPRRTLQAGRSACATDLGRNLALMSRYLFRWAAVLQIGLVLFTGCHPTQPFFIAKDDHLAHYLDQAMQIEYADVNAETLPEASQAHAPHGPSRTECEYVDLSLEDCISLALQNSKIFRITGGSNQLSGSSSAQILSAAPGQLPSVYDVAISASAASTQPLQVDQNGNRVPLRGAVRANQVGGVEDALSEFDAQFSSLMGYNTTNRPRNVGTGNVFNPQFFEAVDSNFQAALSKKTATGGVATIRTTTVYSQNNIPSQSPNNPQNIGRSVPSDWTTALEIQVIHPLMRGRGTLVNRIPVVLARINEDLQTHEFEVNVRNLVKSVEDAYWDLYCGYRAVEASQSSLKRAADLWRVFSQRAEKVDTPQEAKYQAEVQFHQFTAQLQAAKYGSTVPGFDPRGLYGREQVLREKIGWSPTDPRVIRPANEPTLARINFEWSDVVAEGLVRNVELRRQKWAIKQRELELISAKNQILPQLDVSALYRWLGIGDTLANADRNGIAFPNPGSSALEQLTAGDFQEIGARLEFTPAAFGARRPLTSIKSAQLQIAKSHSELQEKEIQLVNELTTAWRNMESQFVLIATHERQWVAAEEEIAVYSSRLEKGVGELAQVLDALLRADQNRSRAQLNYHQAVCEYNKALVNIHYFKGSLLDLNNISLGEGPWTDKAYWDAEELAKQRAAGHYIDYGFTRPGVVSRGPVDAGYLTEGNISSDPFIQSATTPTPEEEEPAKDSSQEKDESSDSEMAPEKIPVPKPDADAPVTKRSMPLGGGLRVSQTNEPTQQTAEQFSWGDLGLAERQQGTPNASDRRVTGSANVQPAVHISSGQPRPTPPNSPPSSTQWRPRHSIPH